MYTTRFPPVRRHPLGGWSLVELMVALTLGLMLSALILHSVLRWTQELRATHAHLLLHRTVAHTGRLIRQEGRGAGYWSDAEAALSIDPSPAPDPNPYAGLWISADGRSLTYGLDGGEGNSWFGIRQHPSNRTLDLRLSAAGRLPADADQWQATTDALQVRLETFTLHDRTTSGSLLSACDTPACPAGDAECPPHWARSGVDAQGTYRMTRDTTLGRNWSASAQARNLYGWGRCPT